jgi:hypothetical protein
MKRKSVILSAIALLAGSLSWAAPASAFVPVPAQRPVIDQRTAATPVDFSIGFSFNNGSPYLHGYRGYRAYRNGYRVYNGFWFPESAFVVRRQYAPRIYERRIYRQPTVISLPYEHVRWCERRYRTYRVYDNSFQPNYGGRRACNSPYF